VFDNLWYGISANGVSELARVSAANGSLLSRHQFQASGFVTTSSPRFINALTSGAVVGLTNNRLPGAGAASANTLTVNNTTPSDNINASNWQVVGQDAIGNTHIQCVNNSPTGYRLGLFTNTMYIATGFASVGPRLFGTSAQCSVVRSAGNDIDVFSVANPPTLTGTVAFGSGFASGLERVGLTQMVAYGTQNNMLRLVQFNNAAQVGYSDNFSFTGSAGGTPQIIRKDGANNVYVGYGGLLARMSKWSPSGQLLWDVEVNEVGIYDIVVRPDGNLLVSSTDSNSNPRLEKVTLFRSSDGVALWSRSLTQQISFSLSVAVASDNSFVMASEALGLYGTSDIYVEWFDANGNSQRRRRLDFGATNEGDPHVKITPTGYTVVAGVSTTPNNGSGFIAVYSPQGELHHTQSFADSGGVMIDDTKLEMQSNGTIVVGYKYFLGTYKMRLVRMDPVRKTTSINTVFNGAANEPQYAIGVSEAGTVYLAQSSPTSRGLVQFNTAGNIAWVRSLPTAVVRVERIITDQQNSVYVGALEQYSNAQGGQSQGGYYVKYNTLGNLVYDRRFRETETGASTYDPLLVMGDKFSVWAAYFSQSFALPGHYKLVRIGQPVPPSVLGETYTVVKGQTLTVNAPGVLANDFDLNEDAITCSILSNPAQGTVTLNANGSFTYVAPSTAGLRNFKYTVRDATGRTTIAQCNLNVTN
jgi:hypothetical protein